MAFLIVSLAGCTKDTSVPDYVIPKEKMVPFLIDIHLAEAKIKVLKLEYDSSIAFYRKLEDEVYKKHQINDSIYMESYNYYLNQPELMVEIYGQVIDSLSLREKNDQH